jgi:hypothetical protein
MCLKREGEKIEHPDYASLIYSKPLELNFSPTLAGREKIFESCGY